MSGFQEIFRRYGADYQTTMARFLGKEDLYLKLLDKLFEDDTLQALGEALDRQDYAAAFGAAHTLKGVVGNMGLTPLYQAVCAIVEPLRAKEPCAQYAAMYQRIEQEFAAAAGFRDQLKGRERT